VTSLNGLFLLVLGLGLLLLLSNRLRVPNCWRKSNLFLRFLLCSQPHPTLRNVENDGAVPFKGDFVRKVKALLRSASVFFRSGSGQNHSLIAPTRRSLRCSELYPSARRVPGAGVLQINELVRSETVQKSGAPSGYVRFQTEELVMPLQTLVRLVKEDDDGVFGPEDIAVMATAFDRLLVDLKLVDRDDPAVTMLAKLVIEIVGTGERDPERIRQQVLGARR
jgi:hypothetical protein